MTPPDDAPRRRPGQAPDATRTAAAAAAPDVLAGGGEMGALMRAFDWAAISLGPVHRWPQSLRTAVRIMLTSRQPIWIGWGEELIYLYNDPYKSIIGGKHPWALGRPASEVWQEIWGDIAPRLATAMGGTEGTYDEEQLLVMERNGYPEETYYTFSYSPIPDDSGGAGGIICANTDDTQRVIGERQLVLLREVASGAADSRAWQEACERSAAALATNPRDLPFAMIYMAEPDGLGVSLAGAAGIEAGHAAAPAYAPLDGPSPWPFAEVLRGHEMRPVADLAARFGDGLPTGAWSQAPARAAALPIHPTGETGRAGVLVVGLNPFRLLDEGYRGFLGLVAGHIAAAVANAQAYEEERRRAEALAELDRAKTAFFANVSHEFRTPLTLMLGPLEEALADSALPAEGQERVEVAHRNALRLLRLVNALLDFSRVEAGRTQALYEPTDLAALTAELASSFRSLCERAGLRLDLDCPPLPEPVFVDREMWEKVVLNLISNAFKFTFEGGIAASLRTAADGAAAELTVRDTGTGIPAAELPRLFERFHRVEGARGRSFEGSGIGLALVRELVRLHGGDIRVESEPGRGSAFTVSIPFGAAHLPPERVGERRTAAPAAARALAYVEEARRWLAGGGDAGGPRDEPAPDLRPPSSAPDDLLAPAPASSAPAGGHGAGRVLLADDNADMRDYVRRLLAGRGYEVEAVADGEAALAAARRRAPDLVLSDVMMPRLDGFGLLRALRAEPGLVDVPVVLLSARAGEEARVEGLDAGADDYLTKPFSARELLARVGANLSLARVRREAAEAVRARSAELEAVLATVPAAVWFTRDADARRASGNRRAAALLRLTEDANASLSAPEGERPAGFRVFRDGAEAAPETLPLQRAAARGEEVRSDEIELRFADGGAPPVVLLCHATPLRDGAGQVAGAVCAAVDITERKAAEAALRESEARFRRTADTAPALLWVTDTGNRCTYLSRSWYEFTGQTPETGLGFGWLDATHPEDSERSSDDFLAAAARREPFRLEYRLRRTDGEYRWAIDAGRPHFSKTGEYLGYVGSVIDIHERKVAEATLRRLNETLEQRVAERTAELVVANDRLREEAAERERAEEALRQSQKMEAVGQLTGGVAHDFNNLLTVVTGNLTTLLRHLPAEGEGAGRLRRSAGNALKGAERAAALTHRLLAFSRRQPLDPKPVEVNRLVAGMSDLLRRTLGETVAVETVLAGGLWPVEADPNQLENALLNLAVNARDAMPGGGKLTIETANAHLDAAYGAAHAEVVPGQYVVICVTDTGTGMPEEVRDRAFEPFFTTKEVGQGTGLGLSQVYGFVKQSGGHVKLYSEPGEGTTVKVYLPRLVGGAAAEEAADGAAGPVPEGRREEVVLVVEDDEDVRAYSTESLRELGYRVLEAADGPSALRLLGRRARVDLLFTDVVLPGGMTGRQLADAARALSPGLRVLYTTGYARNAIVHQGRLDPGVDLLPKPFTYAELAARVRDALDAPG